jgi:predicted nuclease of predicted toxin-antitoxin system
MCTKLLLDENISPRIINKISLVYDEVIHIETLGLRGATDTIVWDFAKENRYVIV